MVHDPDSVVANVASTSVMYVRLYGRILVSAPSLAIPRTRNLREELRLLGIPRADPRAAPPVPLHDTLADASGPGLASGAGTLVCVWGCARGAVGAGAAATAAATLGAADAPAASAGAARPLAVVELLGSAGVALRAREWALGETPLLTGEG